MPLADFTNPSQQTLNGVQDYVAEARIELQDLIPPYRYSDAQVIPAFNMAMLEVRRLRPDLFVFNLVTGGQVPHYTQVDGTFVPIEPSFRGGVFNIFCGFVLKRDQEDYQDARVQSYMAIGNAMLMGRTVPGTAGGSGPGRQ